MKNRNWKAIADDLSKAGWTWGCTTRVDSNGKTIYVADAHRGGAKHFVVRADDELTAFVELERQIRTESGAASASPYPELPLSTPLAPEAQRATNDQKLAEIEARHATDPIWKWLNRTSSAYWGFANSVAGYFPRALARVRSRNPFIGIARLMLVFIAGFIVVPPLYFIIGPLVQIGIVIIAVIWTCLAGVLGWYRTQEALR